MAFQRHITIGLMAVAKGFIDLRTHSKIMIEVGLLAEQTVEDTLWLAPGRLTLTQLQEIFAEIEAGQAPPSRAAERYTPLGLLGSGGMGDVEERLDTVLGRRVAFKVARAGAYNPMARQLLEQEARVTGSLEHPSIIPIYDMGIDGQGRPFYTMRIMRESSLAGVIDRLADRDPATLADFSMGRLLRVFIQVCQAVDYAHSRGFAHRDLKSPNVMLGSYGEVLVADWGLATPLGKPPQLFGGTPGYLPPEQLSMDRPVDPRSDVFSLGAVLYEILCQELPFPHRTGEEAATAAVDPVRGYAYQPLQGRPAPWPIPEALDEICSHALAISLDDRFDSARALASAVEAFLEGTRERERRQRKATLLVQAASELHASYEDLMAERSGRVHEFMSISEQVAPWEPEEKKQAVWDAEEQVAVMEALAVRTMQEVISTYEQALDEVPQHEGAQQGLARLYAAELRRAEDRRDPFSCAYFEERLRQVSDGRPRPNAVIDVDTGELDSEVHLFQFVEQRRRLVPISVRVLGRTPLRQIDVEAGSYLLRFRRSAFQSINYPLLLRPGDRVQVQIDLLATTELAENEVLIPGGPALLGGADGQPPHEVPLPSFILQREPVTFAQYLQFVADVCRAHPELVESYLPLSDEGQPYWSWTGQRFRPDKILRWGDDPQRLIRLPVIGIDAWCAEAYATWRTRRTGRVYRLPTENEWEKAARGVDGRRYPWGDHFDASFCKMSESRPLTPAPEPSGAFPDDRSVYGVIDMAGGVAEWTTPTGSPSADDTRTRRLVSRGGAFCDPPYDCRLTSRRHYLAIERASRLGLRLARTPTGRASHNQIAQMR